MFTQRDTLMQQIERFAARLGRVLAGEGEKAEEIEAEAGRLAGLRTGTAAPLPLGTILGLIGADPQRRLMMGLGLAARCLAAEARGEASPGLADKAKALIQMGLEEGGVADDRLAAIIERLEAR